MAFIAPTSLEVPHPNLSVINLSMDWNRRTPARTETLWNDPSSVCPLAPATNVQTVTGNAPPLDEMSTKECYSLLNQFSLPIRTDPPRGLIWSWYKNFPDEDSNDSAADDYDPYNNVESFNSSLSSISTTSTAPTSCGALSTKKRRRFSEDPEDEEDKSRSGDCKCTTSTEMASKRRKLIVILRPPCQLPILSPSPLIVRLKFVFGLKQASKNQNTSTSRPRLLLKLGKPKPSETASNSEPGEESSTC